MKNIIQFSISKGENNYIAQAIDFPIFTQAETLDNLIENIKEATDLHFKGEDLSEYGFTPKPSLLVNFEVPQYA
jgi:predicted RNase H-like HicB family nuclease